MQIDIGIIGISYICEYIRDLAFDTPKKRYNYVIKQLKESCHPTCSNNCVWKHDIFFGKIIRAPALYRFSNVLCAKCKEYPLAYDHHLLCHNCAEIYDFAYHHRNCNL